MWSPLSDDFKPTALLFRNEQYTEMLKLALHPIPSCMWCQGDKGLGKTLTTRFFSDEVHAKGAGKCYYVDWKSKLTKTLEDLNVRYAFGIPNYALGVSTIAQKIIQTTRESDTICIIIDEPLKAHHIGDVDATVFDLYQTFLNKRKLSIIFLSQMRLSVALKTFSPDTISRLQLKPIIFPQYNITEIVQILNQRLNLMLSTEQYDINALAELGKHISRIGGDIREALDILQVGIEQAQDRLDTKTMAGAIEWGKVRYWTKELNSLPPHWAYLFYLTAEESRRYGSTTALLHIVKWHYLKSCKEKGINPLSTRTIYHVFSKLAEKGYFESGIEGYGRKRITKLLLDEGDRDHVLKVGKEIEWELIL